MLYYVLLHFDHLILNIDLCTSVGCALPKMARSVGVCNMVFFASECRV